MVIFIILTVIFGIMSVALLSEKGAFLIAGYNTSSEKEKAKYDEKKLCRVMGATTSCITAATLLVSITGVDRPWAIRIFLVITFAAIIAALFLTNTICYSEEYKQNHADLKTEIRKSNRLSKVVTGILIVTLIGVMLLLDTGGIGIDYEEQNFTVDASFWADQTISYEEINNICYRYDLEVGSRTNGMGSFRLNEGNFKNTEFGKYKLYAYTACKEYVVLDTQNGIVVLNGADADATRKIYEELAAKIVTE